MQAGRGDRSGRAELQSVLGGALLQGLGKLCWSSRTALKDVPPSKPALDGRVRALEPCWPQQCPEQAALTSCCKE